MFSHTQKQKVTQHLIFGKILKNMGFWQNIEKLMLGTFDLTVLILPQGSQHSTLISTCVLCFIMINLSEVALLVFGESFNISNSLS